MKEAMMLHSRRKKVRTYMIPRRPMTSRYHQISFGHCYSCNNFGHKALNYKAYEKFHIYKKNASKQPNNYSKTKSRHHNSSQIKNLRIYENENSHYKKKDKIFSKYKRKYLDIIIDVISLVRRILIVEPREKIKV